MRIVLLGPPGSGKGTQAVLLSQHFKLQHVATGDLLRDEVARQTLLGRKAKTFMDRGELVPDELVVEMIASRIQNNFVLDGFPRSLGQAEALEVVLKKKKIALDLVINLLVPDEIIIQRLSGRRVCPQCKAVYPEHAETCENCGAKLIRRPDDNPEIIRQRLRVYREKTKPLEDFYEKKGLLENVNGEGSVSDVFERTSSVLRSYQ